ncbi:YcxB family protein [Sporocytophaga myxococcoides]|uniref:YcxB family protein n=1 Tax=Sporocytophaga myxococcoides TaxID=153721 RepID=UPI0004119B9D|nr:YcxB family protein [Sporocytophaga myxococcoides]
MIIKTKKYQLPKNTYVKIALTNLVKKQWWYIFGPILFGCIAIFLPDYKWWFIVTAIIAVVGYILFWAIQFTGVTQLPQNQIMFDKLTYEIDSRQVLIKLNPKQGSPIQWNMVVAAEKTKDAYLLIINKAQIIHLPFKIFNSDNDIRFMDSILKRKEYIK